MAKPLQVEVYDSFTGASVLPVEAAAAPATRRLTGSGDCAFTFKLADLYDRLEAGGMSFAQAKDYARDVLFKRRARMIAVHDGGSIVPYAGFIMKRASVDDAAGTLTVNTSEFRVAASWRMTSGVANVQDATLVRTGKSAEGALLAILDRMVNLGANPRWQFPLDLAALTDGTGSFDVDAQWYDSLYIEDLIQQLEDQGLEVDFKPTRTSSGALLIVPRVAPVIQSSAITDFSVGAANSAILDLSVVEDSTTQFSGVLGAGEGSGSDTMFAPAYNPPDQGIPFADVRRDFADLHTVAAVQRAAQAELNKYLWGTEQWSLSINLDDSGLGWEHVAIGRRLKLDVRNHWWIPDGQYTKRIIATRTGLNGTVGVEVQ